MSALSILLAAVTAHLAKLQATASTNRVYGYEVSEVWVRIYFTSQSQPDEKVLFRFVDVQSGDMFEGSSWKQPSSKFSCGSIFGHGAARDAARKAYAVAVLVEIDGVLERGKKVSPKRHSKILDAATEGAHSIAKERPVGLYHAGFWELEKIEKLVEEVASFISGKVVLSRNYEENRYELRVAPRHHDRVEAFLAGWQAGRYSK